MSKSDSETKCEQRDRPRITVVIGTRAQLIKMAPVMLEMEDQGVPFRLMLTGQHELTMDDLLREFGINTLPEPLFEKQEITGVIQMIFWFPKAISRLVTAGGGLRSRKEPCQHVVLVHGDTASTLVGAIAGRIVGALVAHVEAGLRSFKILDPFPEELIRILVGRLSEIAFAPGDWASGNLNPRRCDIVNTGANTLLDAVRGVVTAEVTEEQDDAAPYCVVTIHRFETLCSKKRMRWLINELGRLESRFQIVFVLHPATRRKLEVYRLYDILENMPHVKLHDRMTYIPFIKLLRKSRLVISDGGSNQEELAYMRKPALILRNSTERREGIGESIELCNFDREHFRLFIESARKKYAGNSMIKSPYQPSKTIVARLLQYVHY